MKLLAIDTSAEACSAALWQDGELSDRFLVQPRGHSASILAMMQGLLEEAGLRPVDLDALAFGRGPGSFTGVRIATGVIQGVAYAVGLPVVPVSNLAALAQRHFRESGARRVLPAFDARMQEVYWGAYEVDDQGLVRLKGEEQVGSPERVSLPEGSGWHGVGSGWMSYGEVLARRMGQSLAEVHPRQLCHALDIARLGVAGFAAGRAVSAGEALPIYLRDRVATPPGA
jgi:tRNA threonylcarbamoyladenosine biosynthesis protein TsaB